MNQIEEMGAALKKAQRTLETVSTEQKNQALCAIAAHLEANTEAILAANAKDMAAGREKGMSDSLLDRLLLTKERIAGFADGVRQVADLPDPVGQIIESWQTKAGLRIEKVRVPIGVIGMIYEARPNVTVDSAALALKSGNAVMLRGSASALQSNKTITAVMKEALTKTAVPADCIALLEDVTHEGAEQMMHLTEYLDVLIPRGGAGLIANVVQNAKVPVIETGVGNCHIFVDESAKPDMAVSLVLNAKTQRPSVCNAAETLLIAKGYPEKEELLQSLADAGVTLHGDEAVRALFPSALPAGERDYAEEYLSLDMCVKIVADLQEATSHIERYGTGHTELIVTENSENAAYFMKHVDAACVNHNASTRFTDGEMFGFGAEIGISTQKTHARGPLGLKELTIYKYLVHGGGQIRE
ncbi:MAG: glutamate-5-semialdehyde dehydrogenase [Clostridiales bacterium]|nr:glutamate-5-semialdehyde dehydrogenase [Clostridiales bacterium]